VTSFKSLRVRASQGTQYISDLRSAIPSGFRGLPVLGAGPCGPECSACQRACPTGAIQLSPLALDLGRCVFCQACVEACPEGKIRFTSEPKLGASRRDDLVVHAGSAELTRIQASATFSKLFGRSLKMRQVSAGGCNACELELNAIANVNFDAQRFGIEWVASPRHADALVVTGPLTQNMKNALRLAWQAMPEPRFVVAVGACAISGGLYEGAAGVDRTFFESVGPSLFVPGCPPHPLTFINAILDFLAID
jgi:Ni,Fe-hydrogenase III small subunit